ncbi:hypothetical protein [Anatilimnocola floriformis]|nr:hypothetical protein [Anatilimnocola floriformis]
MARLSSLNIQQFLGLSAGIFEEAASAELLRKATVLRMVILYEKPMHCC